MYSDHKVVKVYQQLVKAIFSPECSIVSVSQLLTMAQDAPVVHLMMIGLSSKYTYNLAFGNDLLHRFGIQVFSTCVSSYRKGHYE